VSEDHPVEELELCDGHRGVVEGGDQQVQAHSSVKAAGSGATSLLPSKSENKVSKNKDVIRLVLELNFAVK